MEALIIDWIPTLLRKTSEHEGDFWSVQHNLDGNGVSYGILQWTQKSGSLGHLLHAMSEADPAAFQRFFGPSAGHVLDVTGRGSMEPVDGAVLWAEPWASRFEATGRYVPFQAVQTQVAGTSEYIQGAVSIARLLDVQTERALVLLFNRTVHQGPAGATKAAQKLVTWYAADLHRRPVCTNDILAQYAWTCADAFRRTTAPEARNYNAAGNIWWAPVPAEWSELRVGDYHTHRVAVTGVWHALTGPSSKPWSLFDLITKRSSDILTDPSLRDGLVALPNAA